LVNINKGEKKMNLIGSKVVNIRFGAGVIVEVKEKSILVDFNGNVKPFDIEGFNRFFTWEDGEAEDYINKLIEKIAKEREERGAAERAARRAAQEAAERESIITRYDADYHAEHMSTNVVLTYQDVQEKFGIRIAGFGRGANSTADSVVLISSVDPENDNFVYHDRWDNNGDYIFSGEGKVGDQMMTRGNLAIKSAENDNKQIHLFIKESSQEYYYQGVFKLVGYTYEDDIGADGNSRKEYKFRLRRV
jgi:Trp operon repressor